ncbi:MAG: TatD family hydrolase [Myxococcota bacterium]|nr:TatD family hydrolase [Myxococcota bacterium]
MIDFHCHIDLYPDPAAVLDEAVRRQCYVFAVTTTPLAWVGTNRVINAAPGVQVGLGLHPELVVERAREVARFGELVAEARCIGEIGLDGSQRHRESLPLQLDVFRTILEAVANDGGRVMSIHSRGAATETLDELERHVGPSTPVLHWFSGTQLELRRAVELGCWFSVGPAMLKGGKGRKLVEFMPADRVLTETDGPFTRNGKEPLFPWDAEKAEQALGRIWRTGASETRQRLRDNLRTLATKAHLQ